MRIDGERMTGTQIVRDALARHREQPSIGLDLTLPINWQIDSDLCMALGRDLEGVGGAWEVRRATPSLWQSIPSKCGIYMFVYRSHLKMSLADGNSHHATWILYVGRAGSSESARTLKERYRGEYGKYVGGDPENLWSSESLSGRAEMLRRYLSLWPLEYWFLVVEDRGTISHLEDRLIKLFAPPLNRNGLLRLRKGTSQPAFRSR